MGVMDHWFSQLDYEIAFMKTIEFLLRLLSAQDNIGDKKTMGNGFLKLYSVFWFGIGALCAIILDEHIKRLRLFPVFIVGVLMMVFHYYRPMGEHAGLLSESEFSRQSTNTLPSSVGSDQV